MSLLHRFQHFLPSAWRICSLPALSVALVGSTLTAAAPADEVPLSTAYYQEHIVPLLKQYCVACHSGDTAEAEIDLARFETMDHVRRHPRQWLHVRQMLDGEQMPPPDAPQPTEAQRQRLNAWLRAYLADEARRDAGDPGPVVLRRLNNAEYTYTLRDLTGVETLDPAAEFPVDGAAGEGFTNTGQSLVMSPALVTKYLDAAKEVARHAMLLPTGIRFSESTSPSDWTNAKLAEIRALYGRYTVAGNSETRQLQEVTVQTSDGGHIPLERYLAMTIEHRDLLTAQPEQLSELATAHDLSPRYLGLLWQALNQAAVDSPTDSVLLNELRRQWRVASLDDVPALVAFIERWQQSLWRFTTVGHIGKVDGPTAWQEPIEPIATEQAFRWPLPTTDSGEDLVLYLGVGTAGDGEASDLVVWEQPRLVSAGRADLPLRDVQAVYDALVARRATFFATTARCLEAAAGYSAEAASVELVELARQFDVPPDALAGWWNYLGLSHSGATTIGPLLTQPLTSAGEYDFVTGWVGDNALSVVANSSDQAVRIPGNLPARSVAMHPAPAESVGTGWRSPRAMNVTLHGNVQHAHPECGNGVAWTVELRRASSRQQLAAGICHGPAVVPFGPIDSLAVRPGDMVVLIIHPRDGNHACDLSVVNLTLESSEQTWDLASDLHGNILASNPHPDSHGQADTWHFFREPVDNAATPSIVANSLLAQWQVTSAPEQKRQLAEQLQALLLEGPKDLAADDPNRALYQQLTSAHGPLLAAVLGDLNSLAQSSATSAVAARYGIPANAFGVLPADSGASTIEIEAADPHSLYQQAPAVIELRLPAELAAGTELVTTARLVPLAANTGSVQAFLQESAPTDLEHLQATNSAELTRAGTWSDNNRSVAVGTPVLVRAGSVAAARVRETFAEFRELFPAAVCYERIVPIDEVVTLTLLHREDEPLRRLMLSDAETAELDRHWAELHFVSQDALALLDAYAQLMEYATQDADPSAFAPMRKPIERRAAEFRQWQLDVEPVHLDAVIELAEKAYRRPLTKLDETQIRTLYRSLRAEEFSHEDAIRLVIARLFVSPSFLYRIEHPVDGAEPGPISDGELANRLSYFLWSSQPDEELRRLADAGQLRKSDRLRQQTARLLNDTRIRRLATEFACQWLQIYDFDELDEKSERHFPTFVDVREPMYEEAIQFFTDMFQNDRSVLSLLNADHTFLNDRLAAHYGVPNIEGTAWRRVDGISQFGRGGILALGATLSKHSGASRTSPILRGAWLSEVILGERLPRPPKDVPILSDIVPQGLNERQMTELHVKQASCAKCHVRIDPFGFALEGFDAIGRNRQDEAGIDTTTTLPDGNHIAGLADLRDYLLTVRRETFVRQFSRKLLGYALGRAVQLSDEPLLEEMAGTLAANDYRFSVAVDCIVNSPQFQQIRGYDFVSTFDD